MLFAKYEEKVRCLPVVPLCAGSQSAGMSPSFFAVGPFKQDKNQEDASENAKHSKSRKRHIPPISMVRAIRSHPNRP